MRQHRLRARWDESWPPAASREGERDASSGQILELPDQRNLPSRDRLVLLDRDWRDSGPPPLGLIVDDRLDGCPVYPEPPRYARSVPRLRRLLDRATPPMLFFVLLALVQAGMALVDAVSAGAWSLSVLFDLALRLASTSALTLLPAGVLIWGSTTQRSFRLVLAGVIVWSTLPAIAGLGWWIVRLSPGLMDQFGYASAVAVAAVTVISCVGPAIVAYGFERARKSSLTLADMAKLVAALTLLAWMADISRSVPTRVPAIQPAAAGPDALSLVASVGGAALPLEFACLLLLAYSCVATMVVGEARSRFWQCAAAGAALLSFATFDQIMAGDLPGRATSSLPTGSGLAFGPNSLYGLAGGALLLLAFAVPVWSAARGAVSYERGAPDEIFAWGDEAEQAGGEPIVMSTIVAVAAGADHALALDENGLVGAWGDNSVGQVEVPDGLSGVMAVAAGDGFSLALRPDGTVAAWGTNNLGQTEVPPDLAGVTAIAAGRGFALALMADGTVVGWGDSTYGATPVPSGLADATSISAGDYHGLALLRNGTIVAWGDNTYGQLDVPSRLGPATAISAGGDFCVALLADGTVAAWGDNTYGQLDVPAGLANVTAISAGAFHAVALRAAGDVISWGGGGQRQGEAAHPWRLVDFKAVAAGDGFSLAVRAA